MKQNAFKNLFNSVEMPYLPNNNFDLSHDHKTSCNMGYLVPVMVVDAIPGDRISVDHEALVRFAPLVAPMMHEVNVSFHTWKVPFRLVWPNWEDYICNNAEMGVLPVHPYIDISEDNYTRLADYMGIPQPSYNPPNDASERISAIPFACLQLVYNEMYRDQNIILPVNYKLTDGDNTGNDDLLVLRKRAWEHDYFTSALPWAQKGDPVDIPIGEIDDVRVLLNKAPGSASTTLTGTPDSAGVFLVPSDNPDILPNNLYAQTSNISIGATTINDLRRAFALQRLLERDALGGTRYSEFIKAHFGVTSSDARLQRPEYVCGSVSPVVISEVASTVETNDNPQANLAGRAVSVTNGNRDSTYCEEHCYIITLMSILPRTAYQQGIPNHFLRINDRYEYYMPELAHVGEQEIKNRELYAFTTQGDATFGYTPRYAPYRFQLSRISGDFRKSPLDAWHMGRIFETQPTLSQNFIEANPTHRVFAVTETDIDKLYVHVYCKLYANRLISKFGTPSGL